MSVGENFTYSQIFGLVDLIFPPQCAGCGKPGERWCSDCSQKIKMLEGPHCQKCAEPLADRRRQVCRRCVEVDPVYEQIYVLSAFGDPIKSALHRLKYSGDQAIGENIAAEMADLLRENYVSVDVLVPMPISAEKREIRGYNQVEAIGRPLARLLGVEFDPKSLAQIRENRSQVGLNVAERRENVRDVFEVLGGKLVGKRVLLLDDTTTTGATLDFAARALANGGVEHIICAAVAKALIHTINDAIINVSHPNPRGV